MFIWLISDYLLFSTNNLARAPLFSKFVYVGVTGIPFSNLVFSLTLCKQKIKKYLYFILVVVYLILLYSSVATNLVIDGLLRCNWGLYPKAGKFHELYLISWGTIYILGPLLLIKNYRRNPENSSTKYRILYSFFALCIGGAIGASDFIQKYGIEIFPVGSLLTLLIISFISYSILKHNLMDITVAIKKSFFYSLFMLLLTIVFVVIILIIEHVFKEIVGYKSLLISALSSIVLIAIFNPIKNFTQNFIDGFFLGKSPSLIAKENSDLRQKIERSERLKATNTLALGLAHEIRNPLTTLKTFAQYLPKKYHDKEFIDQFSELVTGEVERINDIVTKLLNFSKPTTPALENICASKHISDILSLMNNEMLNKHIRLVETTSDSTLEIKADPNQFKQMIWNLTVNAIQAMPHGGDLKILIKRADVRYALIEVADSGIGIPLDKIKNIFDPFYSTKDEGTGLGLAIVHQIVESHGGKIQVESILNRGTTFRIFWPMQQA